MHTPAHTLFTQMQSTVTFSDPVLQRITRLIQRPVILSTGAVFHDLMSCIVEQQIHYRSSKKIFAKALERSGITHLTPHNFHQFETHALSQITLSARKYQSIHSLLHYCSSHSLNFTRLSDEEVRAELSQIKGIGTWTADMLLLYTLERPDIFPAEDYHLKKIMVATYRLNPKERLKEQMLEVAERWGRQKSLAVLYLLSWKNYHTQA